MKTHVKYTFEAYDGKLFDTEDDCMRYETNSLYKTGCMKCYTAEGYVPELVTNEYNQYTDEYDYETVYNNTIKIEVDRTKVTEINMLCKCVYDYYGLSLFFDVLNDDGTEYVFRKDKFEKVK